ncbi:hypothetical protein [Chryseobacterium polytrichastri]|uniref:Uncharacterized protein n=1 Tax=Chryseobacterium polytrichastri TaxID=1302687 RepID=A0A1M7KCF7_9FLAO|nr:hypothetical protein [Chryseobacterium polytrichastri]SHM62683.1 hypothetical protein SAMN05444267_105910 [Chryseobacterium polytrichastri]
MAKLTIIGDLNPVVGKKEMYTISTINDYFQQIIPTQPLLNPQTPIHWGIFVQEKNTWRRTTDNKEGQAVPYTFGQKSLHFKAIKIVAQQGNESGELIIHPQQAKEPKITKVELLDANYLPLPKGKKISYQDTIIARAHCIEMYKRNVSFTLWEDDAKGEGHDPVINMMNKINPVPIMGIVDEYGVAEAVFRLPMYTMAVQIANARIATGETDEGSTHEYYVTAEYVAKHIMKASPNVNVINPTYIPPAPPSKISANTPETKPIKPKPKADTPKFPITSSGKKQADPDAKILNAEFLNERAQPIEKAEVGDTVIIKITTQHMKGRNVTVRIWEEETGYKTHDKIYEKKWVLPGNENFIKVPITKKIYELGITPEDMRNEKYDYKFQVYFIEVEPDNTYVTSQVIPITKSAKKLEVENSRSVTIIRKPREKKKDSTCICQEQYKDLVWGAKVSCEFRKKVFLISKRNGVDPNNLMAAMAHETGGTFDPTCGTFKKRKDEATEGYVGLLQIGKDSAKDLKITRTELLAMNQIKQLDYIEKYLNLPLVRGKLNTLTDFYLAVLFPVDCGKGNQSNHVVFDNSLPVSYKNGKAIKNLNYWRNVGYAANPAFHKEGKSESGKTFVWEIAENIKLWYDKGELNKVKNFSCQKITETKAETTKITKWHDPVSNPICTLYMQSGGGGKGTMGEHWGLFGKTRNG